MPMSVIYHSVIYPRAHDILIMVEDISSGTLSHQWVHIFGSGSRTRHAGRHTDELNPFGHRYRLPTYLGIPISTNTSYIIYIFYSILYTHTSHNTHSCRLYTPLFNTLLLTDYTSCRKYQYSTLIHQTFQTISDVARLWSILFPPGLSLRRFRPAVRKNSVVSGCRGFVGFIYF